MNKELRKIAKALEAQGFEVTVTSKQHLLVRKDGQVVATISGTPSDHRSLLNGLARLRRGLGSAGRPASGKGGARR